MSDTDDQQFIHQAVSDILDDGEVLTGWVISYEGIDAEGVRFTGHICGPETMTNWLADGLLSWTLKRIREPAPTEDD